MFLPYVVGDANSSPGWNLGYMILKYFSPPFDNCVCLWTFTTLYFYLFNFYNVYIFMFVMFVIIVIIYFFPPPF